MSSSYISFEFNYRYYPHIYFKDQANLRLKSQLVNKLLAKELKK